MVCNASAHESCTQEHLCIHESDKPQEVILLTLPQHEIIQRCKDDPDVNPHAYQIV